MDGCWQSGLVIYIQEGGLNNFWWIVDLGEVYDIRKIWVWNCIDCCKECLDNFVILVKNIVQEFWRGFILGFQCNIGINLFIFEG